MIEYSEVSDFIDKEKFKSILLSIYRGDKSIQFEDVVSDLYLDVFENKTKKLSDKYVEKFLKKYYSETRKNHHIKMIDELDGKEDSYEEFLKLAQESNIILKECGKIKLTKKEILCILYMQNKKNLKKYDYTFIFRKNTNTINKVELCNYYESIIEKLLKNTNRDILDKLK